MNIPTQGGYAKSCTQHNHSLTIRAFSKKVSNRMKGIRGIFKDNLNTQINVEN